MSNLLKKLSKFASEVIYESTLAKEEEKAENPKDGFDFIGNDEYTEDNKIICIRIGKPRKAVQMKEDGEVETREGKATYKAGDWLLTDEQGGQYPVAEADFSRLYDTEHPLEDGFYNPKPQERTFFRTDKEIKIKTEWGDYVASPGDYVQINKDGSYGCPVKPDAMQTGYKFKKKVSKKDADEAEKVVEEAWTASHPFTFDHEKQNIQKLVDGIKSGKMQAVAVVFDKVEKGGEIGNQPHTEKVTFFGHVLAPKGTTVFAENLGHHIKDQGNKTITIDGIKKNFNIYQKPELPFKDKRLLNDKIDNLPVYWIGWNEFKYSENLPNGGNTGVG